MRDRITWNQRADWTVYATIGLAQISAFR